MKTSQTAILQTRRLRLFRWQESHREAFAEMHADPDVMADQGGPISRAESNAKLDRYVAAYHEQGTSRWAVENFDGTFLGYAGVMPCSDPDHPLGFHHEVGWRFNKEAWGYGYATESAAAALEHAFKCLRLDEIISYTSSDNSRSQAVMKRLGLKRDLSRDFTFEYENFGPWQGLVWVVALSDWKVK